ncbi:MAG TPA: oligosaccharide flippase family protein, partial [Candidatus Dormibacteraeota bacterium]|nr:oligosaccharide flippase family protein [Candidatus Dormibacteraeota bacterium]
MLPEDLNVRGDLELRTFRGVFSLLTRDVFIRLLGLVGSVVLARKLSPSTFGLFAVGYFAIGTFGIFSELGLGAAFIRQSRDPDKHDLDALFTFQLVVVCLLALVMVVLAPLLAGIYHLAELEWLVRALALSLVLSGLRTVPIVIAERKLTYGPVALSDMGGQIAYWGVAITMATLGFGIWSLATAVIASSAVGTVVLFLRTSWRPSLQFHWGPIWIASRFGVLYQSQSAIAFVKDSAIPAFGGLAYGSAAVGYLTWSSQLALVPMALVHLVSRVSYSSFSRLQDHAERFDRLVELSAGWTFKVTFPALAVVAGLAPQIIVIVYGSKWIAALPSLYLLLVNMALGVGTTVLLPTIYSVGRARAGLQISIVWTAVTWAGSIILHAVGMDFEGLALAAVLGTATALTLIVKELQRFSRFSLTSV